MGDLISGSLRTREGGTSLKQAHGDVPLDGVAVHDCIDYNGVAVHDCIDYNGVAFSIELLEWGRTFSDFLG